MSGAAIDRRRFGSGVVAGLAASAVARPALSQRQLPRVVIVGGGVGGATAARFLATESRGRLAITMVEPEPSYRTCFFSNLMMAGLNGGLAVDHDYAKLAQDFGVQMVHEMVARIEPAQRIVTLASGRTLAYDRLVLSPGIEFRPDGFAGYASDSFEVMPHAWRRDQKIEVLAARIKAMPQGGTFAIVVPENPYRCPPGPYERASMVAHVLKQTNPTAKVLVIDNKAEFSKQGLFLAGWKQHYGDMITWLPRGEHGGVTGIKAKSGTIDCAVRTFQVDAACIVPPQQAGAVAIRSGLADAGGWCPVAAATMQSTLSPEIHVIGDASRADTMPKSAESAANQARIAGAAICRALISVNADVARIANTCWSLIGSDDGVKIGATYAPEGNKFVTTSTYISTTAEHPTVRKSTYRESLGWYRHVTTQMFGGIDA